MQTVTEQVAGDPVVPGWVHQLAKMEYERGYQLAVSGRRIEVDMDDLDSLEQLVRPRARIACRSGFDPCTNPEDRALASRRGEIDRELAQLRHAEAFLRLDIDEATISAETARAGISEPEAPVALMCAFMAVFAATVAPTLHDSIFFGLDDEVLKWVCSFLVAGCVGASVVLALFTAARLVPGRPGDRAAVVAGIIISLGLAALRAAGARSIEEFLLTFGLLAVEVGVILYGDHVADRYRQASAECEIKQVEADKLGRQADTLGTALSAGETKKAALIANRDAIDAHITERSRSGIEVADLESLLVKSAHHGYRNGVVSNQGRMARSGGAS